MNRTILIQQLHSYALRCPREAYVAARFIHFLSTREEAFERDHRPGHITGSSWLVNRAGTHVLLTHHKKLNIWVQLGGHADGDSDILRVALREAGEESGLCDITPVSTEIFDLDIHEIPARGSFPAHLHWDIRYALRADGGEVYTVSEESHDLRWVEIAALQDFSNETTLLRMAKKWLVVNGE